MRSYMVSGDDFEDVLPQDDVAFNADFHDILKDIDDLIGPEPAHDPPTHQDDPIVDDGEPSPIVPPTIVPKEETKPKLPSSPVSPRPLPHISPPSPHPRSPHPRSPHILPPRPPQSSPMHPQPKKKKKKRGVGRMWEKLKGLFTGEDQPQTKLSDKLVPESDDEARWYGFLFPKSPKPTKTRK